MSVDVSAIRQQFPLLQQAGLVYLDTAASSQKPLTVLDGMDDFYRTDYSNVHRGAHFLADRATEKFENARAKLGKLINTKSTREIVFTANATAGINLVAHSLGDMEVFQPGDRIILTRMEHHANLVPWLQLAEKFELQIDYLEIDAERNLVLADLEALLKQPTKLLALTHVSNVLGTCNPVAEICAKAKAANVIILVDAAQSVPHMPVDVQAIDCDFLVFSAHKMYGPSGVGILYGKLDLLKKMPPFLGGGEMIREVRYDGFVPNEVPYKFEAGTPPITEAIGAGLAVDFLQAIGMDNIHQHDLALTSLAHKRLAAIDAVRILSNTSATGLVTFVVNGVQSYDIADGLSDNGICVRVGHHCAEPLHDLLGIKTSVRASFGIYNTEEEVERFGATLEKVIAENL